MFSIILTLVGTLLHLFVFWHIVTLPPLRKGRGFRLTAIVAAVIWLLYAGGSLFAHGAQGGAAALLEQLTLEWLGVLFIVTSVLLLVDVMSLPLMRCPRCLLWLRGGGFAIALLLVTTALVQGIRSPVVIEQDIALEGLPQRLDGSRVVLLSDLHLGAQLGPEWMAERVRQVQALEPDLILLLGDSFEGHGEPTPGLLPVLRELQAPLGVFAVTGNHEHFGDTEPVLALTSRAGVIWLRDESVEVSPGLVLAGVDDLTIRWRRGEARDYVTPVLRAAPKGVKILLSHSPLQYREAAAAGAALMLSGHTHGGQIWPFTYLVQQFYPYIAGRHSIDGMTLLVSRGTGLWGPRMRLCHPAEIHLLTLHSG